MSTPSSGLSPHFASPILCANSRRRRRCGRRLTTSRGLIGLHSQRQHDGGGKTIYRLAGRASSPAHIRTGTQRAYGKAPSPIRSRALALRFAGLMIWSARPCRRHAIGSSTPPGCWTIRQLPGGRSGQKGNDHRLPSSNPAGCAHRRNSGLHGPGERSTWRPGIRSSTAGRDACRYSRLLVNPRFSV